MTKQALQKHNRRHTEDPEIRPYACDYPGCNSTFKQKDHVRNHIRRTHEKTDEVFECKVDAALISKIYFISNQFSDMPKKIRSERCSGKALEKGSQHLQKKVSSFSFESILKHLQVKLVIFFRNKKLLNYFKIIYFYCCNFFWIWFH